MMVEVPAAALKVATFLPYLDFISIGTNDLTQYTLAAERGNAAVAALSDALDPGVLELIRHVCDAAQGRVPVAVCGEAAADETAIPVLLGLGVRELSVVAPCGAGGQGAGSRSRPGPLHRARARRSGPRRRRRRPGSGRRRRWPATRLPRPRDAARTSALRAARSNTSRPSYYTFVG